MKNNKLEVHYNKAGNWHYHEDGKVVWKKYNKDEPAPPQIALQLKELNIKDYEITHTGTGNE